MYIYGCSISSAVKDYECGVCVCNAKYLRLSLKICCQEKRLCHMCLRTAEPLFFAVKEIMYSVLIRVQQRMD